MATQTFKNFKAYASLLESELGIKYDAKPYKETIRIMLDGYCKAMDEGDERLKTLYVSGLMLRFWDKIGKLEAACPNIGMRGDDFADWLYEAIEYACKYRKWQVDPNVNAQQCVNQCVETIRKQHYYNFNLDKNKANYNVVSFETPIGGEGDNGSQKTLEDTLADESDATRFDAEGAIRHVVQTLLDNGKLVEAIIMDVILSNDVYRQVKHAKTGVDEYGTPYKYFTYTTEFWRFKAVQVLSGLPEGYSEYFLGAYEVKQEAFKGILDAMKRWPNNKWYRELDASRAAAKTMLRGTL